MDLDCPGRGLVAEPFIGLGWQPAPTSCTETQVQFLIRQPVVIEFLREALEILVTLPLLPFWLFCRKDLIGSRLLSRLLGKVFRLVEKAQLSVDLVHPFGLSSKTVQVRDTDLLDQVLKVLVHPVKLALHRHDHYDKLLPAAVIQFIDGITLSFHGPCPFLFCSYYTSDRDF